MNLQEFGRINRQRCESPDGFNHWLDSWSASDWFTAVLGELGEAANIAKKLNRVRDGIPGNKQTPEELRSALARELADTFIYLDLLAQSQGISLAEVVPDVFNAKSAELGCAITYPERSS
jgi:NTP pyrophosphatase (non-canonical NTP hydrolase)